MARIPDHTPFLAAYDVPIGTGVRGNELTRTVDTAS